MKPVAYIDRKNLERLPHEDFWVNGQQFKNSVPLYTHPHPDNLGLAESIIKQQQLRIAELEAKIDEMAGDIMTLENRIGTMTGYGHN